MAFHLAQISDTHLSARHPAFVENFAALATHLREAPPDLVINTGDVSAHGEQGGEEAQADLEFACAQHAALGIECLMVPGNHDVGNDPAIALRNGADEERLARWKAVMGADRFVRDVPGWRLIGINCLISAMDLGAEQFFWLEEVLAGATGRSLALFLHKPLCEKRFDEVQRSYWTVLPQPRRRLLDLFSRHPLAFVATGHVHQWRDREQEGMRQIWAPAVAFHVGDAWVDGRCMGEKVQGYVRHSLHEDGRHEHALICPPGLTPCDLGDMPEAYGALEPA